MRSGELRRHRAMARRARLVKLILSPFRPIIVYLRKAQEESPREKVASKRNKDTVGRSSQLLSNQMQEGRTFSHERSLS